jgi:predicted neutral ceramidase superfamily lipid hydrolase
MLGVKPFGNLSLSLSIVYFFAMAILILISATEAMGSVSVGGTFIILLVTFSIIGIALFIAPLYTVHKRMVEEKDMELTQLRSQVYKSVEAGKPETQDTVAEMKKRLDNLTSVMALEMAEKNLNSIPNWPIDAPIISKFATIIISVIAILLANLILQFLRH